MYENKIIVIQGPTASGKTKVALLISQKYKSEIISADSRQIYKELSIGTAKPPENQLNQVKHHFINSISINEAFNVWDFEQQALAVITNLFSKGIIPIVSGGSGLFIDALLKGLNTFPEIPAEVKIEIELLYKNNGISSLQAKLEKLDPDYFSKVDKNNHRRLIRALEVCISSGKPYSTFIDPPKAIRNFTAIKIGLDLPRNELYEIIRIRCDEMIQNGFINEAINLYRFKNLPALNSIGYNELFSHFDGNMNLQAAIEKFKQHSCNYAKKQLTWLRKDRDITWFSPFQENEILEFVSAELQKHN